MAEPTPTRLANKKPPQVRKVEHYQRDLYNFSYTSVSQGTNNPPVYIPTMGPHAAGAVPPSRFPQVAYVEVIINGSSTNPPPPAPTELPPAF